MPPDRPDVRGKFEWMRRGPGRLPVRDGSSGRDRDDLLAALRGCRRADSHNVSPGANVPVVTRSRITVRDRLLNFARWRYAYAYGFWDEYIPLGRKRRRRKSAEWRHRFREAIREGGLDGYAAFTAAQRARRRHWWEFPAPPPANRQTGMTRTATRARSPCWLRVRWR